MGKPLKFSNRARRLTLSAMIYFVLVACSSDSNSLYESVPNVNSADQSTAGSNDTSTNNGTTSGNSSLASNNTSAGGGSTSENSTVPPTFSLGWIELAGNNTVIGSPLITDSELIVTGGDNSFNEPAQIKAYSTSGVQQPWPATAANKARDISAIAEVTGDPNGNIYAFRLLRGDNNKVRLVARDATGQFLPAYEGGGGWKLRTAPSIDAGGRVFFAQSYSSVGVRETDGTVSVLTVTDIESLLSKPAVSRANIAYFTVDALPGLVSVNLTTGASDRCLGASPSWSSPAIDSIGNVVFGTTSGQIMACSATMEKLWTYPDDDLDSANAKGCNPTSSNGDVEINMTGSPVIDATNNIYIRSNNGFIYSLSVEGKLRWCHDTGVTQGRNQITGTPMLTSGGHLIYVDEKGISVLDHRSGELLTVWEDNGIVSKLRRSVATPTITPSGLLVFRNSATIAAVVTNTTLDTNAAWPKWGADWRNSGLQR